MDGEILHALNGKTSLNGFKIPRLLDKKQIGVLIDSRSTNSFVDEMLMDELKLPVVKTSTLVVTVANGEKMESVWHCKCLKRVM